MKTIYLECNMGAAGDMLMSALYEICDQKEWFLHKMNTVFAPYHIALSPESAVSCGINGTHMKVTVDGTEEVSLDVKAGHAHHTHAAESPDASFAHEASDSAEDGHSHTHTTYAAVCEGEAVCGGIADAYVYLLERGGIPARVVTGTSLSADGAADSHAWVAAELDGAV